MTLWAGWEFELHLSENTEGAQVGAEKFSLCGLKICITRTRRKQDTATSFVTLEPVAMAAGWGTKSQGWGGEKSQGRGPGP